MSEGGRGHSLRVEGAPLFRFLWRLLFPSGRVPAYVRQRGPSRLVEATVSPGFQGHQPPVSSLHCSTPPPNVITRCRVSPWETRCFSLFCAFCLGCFPSLDQLLTCPTPYPLCDLWTNSYSLHASVPQSRKWSQEWFLPLSGGKRCKELRAVPGTQWGLSPSLLLSLPLQEDLPAGGSTVPADAINTHC